MMTISTLIQKYIKSLDTCILCVYIIFIGGLISYYSYGIYTLSEEYNRYLVIYNKCHSKLWYYGLFSIVGFTDKILLRNIESIKSYSYLYYLMFLIEIMLVIFGSIEIWGKKCIYDYISKTSNLYIFCIINISLQLIVTFFLIIKIILMNKYNENTQDININNINNRNNVNYMTNEEYIDSSSNDYNENTENYINYMTNEEYIESCSDENNENTENNEYTKYNGYNGYNEYTKYNESNKQCTDV